MSLYLVPPLNSPEPEEPVLSLELVHIGAGCGCSQCSSAPLPISEQFCYTVGLSTWGHPELLVHGLDPEGSADLLNRWGQVVLAGDHFYSGDLLCEGPLGQCWEVLEVAHPEEVLLWANDRYRADSLRVSALEIMPTTRTCRCRGSR